MRCCAVLHAVECCSRHDLGTPFDVVEECSNGEHGVGSERCDVRVWMIDEHLFGERAGSLRVAIGEVASKVVECGLMWTGVAVDECSNRARGGGRSASVVFEKYECDAGSAQVCGTEVLALVEVDRRLVRLGIEVSKQLKLDDRTR